MNSRILTITLIVAAAAATAAPAPTKKDAPPAGATAQPEIGRAEAQALADARCRAMFGEGEARFKEKIGPVWVFRTALGYAGKPGPDISIVEPFPATADRLIDPQAPAFFARLIAASNYVWIPQYDRARRAMLLPVIVRDRARLDELARIIARAVFQPTSHVLAVTAGGPVTFFGANRQPTLKLERFGDVVRLDGQDYRIDHAAATALTEWFKRVDTPRAPGGKQP